MTTTSSATVGAQTNDRPSRRVLREESLQDAVQEIPGIEGLQIERRVGPRLEAENVARKKPEGARSVIPEIRRAEVPLGVCASHEAAQVGSRKQSIEHIEARVLAAELDLNSPLGIA